MAGLLEGDAIDDYQIRIQNEFRYLQYKFELPAAMDVTLWRFLRIRPDNFPYVRLAQLASLYHKEHFLFSRIMEAETLKAVRQILVARTSPYWEEHFVLASRLPKRKSRSV